MTNKELRDALSAYIREQKRELHISNSDIHRDLGVSTDTVKAWIAGEYFPRPENLQALVEYFVKHGGQPFEESALPAVVVDHEIVEVIPPDIERRLKEYRKRGHWFLGFIAVLVGVIVYGGSKIMTTEQNVRSLTASVDSLTDENDSLYDQIEQLEAENEQLIKDKEGLKTRIAGLNNKVATYKQTLRRIREQEAEQEERPEQSTTPSATTEKPAPAKTMEFRRNKTSGTLHEMTCGTGKNASNTEVVHYTYEQLMNYNGNYCGNCDPEKTPPY